MTDDGTSVSVGLLFSQSSYHGFRSEFDLSRPVAQQLEHIGEKRNERAALLLGHYIHATADAYCGSFVAACDLFKKCDGLRDHRAFYATFAPDDIYTDMLVILAEALANLGHIDQAQTCLDKALLEARRLQQPYTLVAALGFGTYALWPSGSSVAAARQADEMIAISNEQGFPLARLGDGTPRLVNDRARSS